MEKTLKEIYGWELISDEETSLIKHINKILMKTPSELDTSDICVLIRQELFLDISIPKAIKMIKTDHKTGDNYEYDLLVNLSKISTSLKEYRCEILNLISILEKDYKNIVFELESDKKDYVESIARLKDKIK